MFGHFGQGVGEHGDDGRDDRFDSRVHRGFDQRRNDRLQRFGDHLETVGVVLAQHERTQEREDGHDVVQHMTGAQLGSQGEQQEHLVMSLRIVGNRDALDYQACVEMQFQHGTLPI